MAVSVRRMGLFAISLLLAVSVGASMWPRLMALKSSTMKSEGGTIRRLTNRAVRELELLRTILRIPKTTKLLIIIFTVQYWRHRRTAQSMLAGAEVLQ